jgi:outer membrane immunogenic protein
MSPTRWQLLAAAGLLISLAPAQASADDYDFLLPLSTKDLGQIQWTGLMIRPDLGFPSLNFSGSGAGQLKTASGFSAGGEAGYDWQLDRLVLGAAFNLAWTDIGADSRGNAGETYRSHLNATGTVRGRVGYVLDRFMIYGTGGFAFSSLQIENRSLGLKDTQDLGGFVAGGGAEWAYNKLLTLRAEFTHLDFKQASFSSLPAGQNNVGGTINQVKFGFVHRF